jgi:site-specific recombinase XerD
MEMRKRTDRAAGKQEEVDQFVGRFLQDLERHETSPKTREAYRLDLLNFARWFDQTVGERFSPEAITPTDVREYRGYLLNVEKRQPSTVNRRLAALKRFFGWAKAMGLAKELATENVRGVASSPRAPVGWRSARSIAL